MKFTAKVYKLGRSGRLAIMLPKEVVLTPAEYEIEIKEESALGASENVPAPIPEVVAEPEPERTVLFEGTF